MGNNFTNISANSDSNNKANKLTDTSADTFANCGANKVANTSTDTFANSRTDNISGGVFLVISFVSHLVTTSVVPWISVRLVQRSIVFLQGGIDARNPGGPGSFQLLHN